MPQNSTNIIIIIIITTDSKGLWQELTSLEQIMYNEWMNGKLGYVAEGSWNTLLKWKISVLLFEKMFSIYATVQIMHNFCGSRWTYKYLFCWVIRLLPIFATHVCSHIGHNPRLLWGVFKSSPSKYVGVCDCVPYSGVTIVWKCPGIWQLSGKCQELDQNSRNCPRKKSCQGKTVYC